MSNRADHRENPRPTNTALHTIADGIEGKIHPLVSKALAPETQGWGIGDLGTETETLEPHTTTDPQLKGSLELALQDTDTHPPDTTNLDLEPDLGSSQAATIWAGETPPTLIFTDIDKPDPALELLMHSIWQLFLRGYPPDAIGRKVGISYNRTRRLLGTIKQRTMEYMVENPQVFGAPLETLYLQTLRRRERQSALWEELEKATMESVRPQFYRLIAEEDKAIENLLGLSKETLAIVLGTPAQHASADLLRQAGPDSLKEILVTIRDICEATTGELPALESTQTIAGSVRELKPTPRLVEDPSLQTAPQTDLAHV